MLNLQGRIPMRYSIEEAIRNSVSEHIIEMMGSLGRFDQVAERRVHAENMAKIELVDCAQNYY